MAGYSLSPTANWMPRARNPAQRALELDPDLPDAHVSLAEIVQNYDWDWDAAEAEFRRAIELGPNYATAHHWYAQHLPLSGRINEALTEIELVRRLDPLSLIIIADHGAILHFARRDDEAIATFGVVLGMEPRFPRAYMVVYADIERGRYAEALEAVERFQETDNGPWPAALAIYVDERAGRRDRARPALRRLRARPDLESIDSFPLVVANIGLGNLDEAVTLLERAYAERSPALTALAVDPLYDPLRGDPRFERLLVRLGLRR